MRCLYSTCSNGHVVYLGCAVGQMYGFSLWWLVRLGTVGNSILLNARIKSWCHNLSCAFSNCYVAITIRSTCNCYYVFYVFYSTCMYYVYVTLSNPALYLQDPTKRLFLLLSTKNMLVKFVTGSKHYQHVFCANCMLIESLLPHINGYKHRTSCDTTILYGHLKV